MCKDEAKPNFYVATYYCSLLYNSTAVIEHVYPAYICTVFDKITIVDRKHELLNY